MADRGRDLKLSFLSDVDQFKVDDPVRGLEQLADAAAEAGDKLDELDGDKAGRALRDLDDGADRAGRALRDLEDDLRRPERGVDDLADQARRSARSIGDAFGDIARAAKTNMRKVDDDLDDAAKGFDEFKDEARSSGRETAASFGGGFDDVVGFVQETAANAFGGFGAIGAAAGIAAAAGIGIVSKFFSDSKEKAEESKAAIGEWVDAFIEGQGKVTAATVEGKLRDILGDPEQYREIIKLTDAAHVSAALYARALAGDADAAKKVKEQIIEQQRALASNTDATSGAAAAQANQAVQLQRVAEKLGIATSEIDQGRDAWQLLDEATRAGITADVEVRTPTARELANERASMQRELGRPLTSSVRIDGTRAARQAWGEADAYFRRNPITIRTKGPTGQRPVRDVP